MYFNYDRVKQFIKYIISDLDVFDLACVLQLIFSFLGNNCPSSRGEVVDKFTSYAHLCNAILNFLKYLLGRNYVCLYGVIEVNPV